MRCRSLVPSLALVVGAVSLPAADLDPLTVGGFVDTWLTISDVDDQDDLTIDFAAEAELQIGWWIGEDVYADLQIDIFDSGATLETAMINWELTDQVTFMMGQYINVLGWEAADAPARYRFDRTFLVSEGNLYGAATNTGAGVAFTPTEDITAKFFIQDMVYGEHAAKGSDQLGFIGDLVYNIDGYGSVNLEAAYDQGNAGLFAASAAEEDVFAVSANTTVTAVEDWTFGAELFFLDFDAASRMGFMAMGNYAFHELASASLFAAYLEPNDDVDDDEGIEIALALLTTPTGDANFALNFEVKYQTYDDANPNGEKDEVTAVIEMLAIIP